MLVPSRDYMEKWVSNILLGSLLTEVDPPWSKDTFGGSSLGSCTEGLHISFPASVLYGLPNHLPSSSFGIAFKVRLLTARKIFLLYSTSFLNPKQNCWCSLHLTPCSFSSQFSFIGSQDSHYLKKKKMFQDLAVLKTIIKRGHQYWIEQWDHHWNEYFYTLQMTTLKILILINV